MCLCVEKRKHKDTKEAQRTQRAGEAPAVHTGILIVVIGLAWPWLPKLGLGRLPGDIVVQREGFSFTFPLVTCLILSAVASLVFWLMRR